MIQALLNEMFNKKKRKYIIVRSLSSLRSFLFPYQTIRCKLKGLMYFCILIIEKKAEIFIVI